MIGCRRGAAVSPLAGLGCGWGSFPRAGALGCSCFGAAAAVSLLFSPSAGGAAAKGLGEFALAGTVIKFRLVLPMIFESGHASTAPEFLDWRANHPHGRITATPQIPLERLSVGSGSELRPHFCTPLSSRALADKPAQEAFPNAHTQFSRRHSTANRVPTACPTAPSRRFLPGVAVSVQSTPASRRGVDR